MNLLTNTSADWSAPLTQFHGSERYSRPSISHLLPDPTPIINVSCLRVAVFESLPEKEGCLGRAKFHPSHLFSHLVHFHQFLTHNSVTTERGKRSNLMQHFNGIECFSSPMEYLKMHQLLWLLMNNDIEARQYDIGTTSIRLVRVGNVIQILFSSPL
jgi:hypothetical protein